MGIVKSALRFLSEAAAAAEPPRDYVLFLLGATRDQDANVRAAALSCVPLLPTRSLLAEKKPTVVSQLAANLFGRSKTSSKGRRAVLGAVSGVLRKTAQADYDDAELRGVFKAVLPVSHIARKLLFALGLLDAPHFAASCSLAGSMDSLLLGCVCDFSTTGRSSGKVPCSFSHPCHPPRRRYRAAVRRRSQPSMPLSASLRRFRGKMAWWTLPSLRMSQRLGAWWKPPS